MEDRFLNEEDLKDFHLKRKLVDVSESTLGKGINRDKLLTINVFADEPEGTINQETLELIPL